MTSNVLPVPFVASASSEFNASFQAFEAFDGDLSTAWASLQDVDAQLEIDTGTATTVGRYSLLPMIGTLDFQPHQFTFEGSNDGSSWTVLDTNMAQEYDVTGECIRDLPAPATFRYFRWNMLHQIISGGLLSVRRGQLITLASSTEYALWNDGDSLAGEYGLGAGSITVADGLAEFENLDTVQYGLATHPAAGIGVIDAAAPADTDPALGTFTATKPVLLVTAGVNDIFGGSNAATVRAAMTTYVNARIAAGWTNIVIFTIAAASSVTGGADVQRLAYNAALVATPIPGTVTADIAGNTAFQNPADTTYYQGDGVHWTEVGRLLAASIANTVIHAAF